MFDKNFNHGSIRVKIHFYLIDSYCYLKLSHLFGLGKIFTIVGIKFLEMLVFRIYLFTV